MFKNILLPTDGSARSDMAIQAAVHFARGIGAQVTGLHVIPPVHLANGDSSRNGGPGKRPGSETHKVLTHSQIPVRVFR